MAGLRWLPAVLMPFAFVLLACGLLSRNPTIVGADRLLKDADEPARGMIRVTRHPIMWGFILWAVAHLLARGELKAHGVLRQPSSCSRRSAPCSWTGARKRPWARTGSASPRSPPTSRSSPSRRAATASTRREIGWRNPAIGLALYALFFHAHAWLFGANPW